MLELTGLAGDPASAIHRLDPRAKLMGLIGVTVVAVSAPFSAWPVWIVCACVLAAVAGTARIRPRVVWRRARVILPLVIFAAVFLPFVRPGGETIEIGPFTMTTAGLETFAGVSAKATIGVVGAVLLGATTTFPSVLRGLEALRVPRLFVLIAAFAYRYLFVVVDEVQRMRAALASRAYRPRNLRHAGALGRVATALFLRTYARGERVYLAMLSRGYAGSMPQLEPLSFARADAVFLALVVGTLVPARVLIGAAV